MTKLIFYILLVSFSLSVNKVLAQKEESASVSNVTKFTFFLPGITYEQKVAKYKTLYFAAYMDIWLSQTKAHNKYRSNLAIGPTVNAQFRNYYNYKSRKRQNLRTELNSLNYISPIYLLTYIQTTNNSNPQLINQLGAVWGMQRNYLKRFSLDLYGGLGYLFNGKGLSNNNSVWPIAQVSLGLWLNKK